MTDETLQLTSLPPLRLAQVATDVLDTSEIPGAVAALVDLLAQQLDRAGLPLDAPSIRTFTGHPDSITVAVGVELDPDRHSDPIDGLALVDLPPEPDAASHTHRGRATATADAWEAMEAELANRGLQSHGTHRQIRSTPDAVLLQCPVRAIGTC